MRERLQLLGQAVKENPLLAFMMLPPWGFTDTVRRYVTDKIDLEEAKVRLRVVAGDDYDRYIIVAEKLREWSEHRMLTTGWMPFTERGAIAAVTELVAFGEEPTNLNVHEKYQAMIWGML